MPRLPNTDTFLPDQYYHIYNHAIGNENLFRNRDNYLYFLNRVKIYIPDVCRCYAYCLMPNHFHFLVQIRSEAEIDAFLAVYKPGSSDHPGYHRVVMNQFSRMLNGYAQAYNKMFERKGSLFLDYMRRKEVVGDHYLNNLICYIHNNPRHHGFCSNISDWEFSSYQSLCSDKSTQVERRAVMDLFGTQECFEHFHRENQRHAGIISELEL